MISPSSVRRWRFSASDVRLRNADALRGLASSKEGLDQLTLTTNRHSREPLVPLALWYVGLGVEPLREQLKLRRWNLAALDPIEEMLEESGRKILAANLRHGGPQMP